MKKTLFISAAALLLCAVLFGCAFFPTAVTDVLEGNSSTASAGDTVTISRAEYEELLKYQELAEIQEIINQYYLWDTDEEALLEGAAAGMLEAIDDPYTFYYTPKDYADMYEDSLGEYAGVGMMISADYKTNLCTITRVFKNSPALEAGVKRGDLLIKVNDMDVTAENLTEAVEIIRGEIGTPVTITLKRGDEEIVIEPIRAKVEAEYVNSAMLEGNIGYVSLYQFTGKCSQQLIDQTRALVDQGARGLILDLRDNPGGSLSDGESIADLFLGAGTLAKLVYKDGSEETYYTTDSSSDILDIPLVILLNENSASCSEVVSGALQDRGRATIVGTQSYGKGIVQWVLGIGDKGAGMQLTIAEYYTPNGNKVHKVGLTPDVQIEMPEEETGIMFDTGDLNDTQLRTAYETVLALLEKQ